jgi:AraC-like DNA-binding protein
MDKSPHIYQCHAGLVDFSIPIMAGDTYVAAVQSGQFRIEDDEALSINAVMARDDSWRRDSSLQGLYEGSPRANLAGVRKAADTLWALVRGLDRGPRPPIATVRAESPKGNHLSGLGRPERPAPASARPLRPPAVTSARPLRPPAATSSHPARPPVVTSSRPARPPVATSSRPPRSAALSLPRLARSFAAPVAGVTSSADRAAMFWAECDAENLPAAFAKLRGAIDAIWDGPPAGRSAGLDRLECGIINVARSLCPETVVHLQHRVAQHGAGGTPQPHRHQAEGRAEALLVMVFEGIRRARPRRQRNFQDLLNEIERRGAKAYSLTEAAHFLGLSPGHLSKKFKAQTGSSFLSYVMARRIRRAGLLLAHTDLPVVRIASEVGFQQANYFARVFRAETGLSPSEFRSALTADQH